jgi:leucyl aminopeptidase
LPLTVGTSLLSQLGAPPLDAHLEAILAGEVEPEDLIAVTVESGGSVRASPQLDAVLPVAAAQLVAASSHTGKPGEISESAFQNRGRVVRVLFVGVGDRSDRALRRAGAELGRRCAADKTAAVDAADFEPAAALEQFIEGVLLGSYRFSLRSQPAPAGQGHLHVLTQDPADASGALSRAEVTARAVALARDLANTPSALKSPEWLATESARLVEGTGIEISIRREDELAAEGFGGILAVGGGSARPPRLIQLDYSPAGASTHVVLVGKGITFDSGGLSLKPNEGMIAMKTDMAGGAVVIATLCALAELGAAIRVTGLVAAAENMPSGSAYRPGDVITQYDGRSVEVLNTDAEGRLVLADALGYAAAKLAPDTIVDIATLTGAARVALGGVHAALYSTSDDLAAELATAGEASGDRLWRMPLPDDYRASLDSPVADIAHVATDHNPAGSVTAALFLREFVAGVPWAHLDIAGPGRSSADDGELSKGATGFGVRVLLSWLTPSD